MVFKLGFIRKEESLILAVLLVNTLQSIFILLAVSINFLLEKVFAIGIIDKRLSETMKALISQKDDVINHFAHFFAFIILIGGKRRF